MTICDSRDNYPNNIESPQQIFIEYAADIDFDYSNGQYPTGNESAWKWESHYIPIPHKVGSVSVGKHVFMRIKVGISGKWTYPIKMGI
ncbi:MAG: hypothetical protein GY775_19300 [Candidatus Scalindua sp.]|nr:hypothetical protein [Candidatus Scalindua sp.]